MAEDVVDVLIVGAGASGAAVAWSLAETRMRIVCLEQGDWQRQQDYPSTRRDWEVWSRRRYNLSPNVRAWDSDYPINEEESPISPLNFNGVGGGTILYAAHFPRMHPSDFRVRTLDGVADDWPIDYATLEPFFEINDRMMGVSGLAGDPATPPRRPPLPPTPMGLMGERLARTFNKLGWHWWPSDSAIATAEYDGRAACLNLGPCTAGCPQGAKGSVDVTYWPHALRAGVELRTRCRVREVTVDERGMASGVVYFDEQGVERHQRAHVVILACNGIGTPRLLLNSVSDRFPRGLANSSDQVGRNLMFHPWGMATGLFDEDLQSGIGPQGSCLWSQEFYETDARRGYVRGFTLETIRMGGPVSMATEGVRSGEIPWGSGHHEAFRRRFNRCGVVGVITEDLPEPENRVTLDPLLKDGSGIPAPKVTYRLGENTRRILADGLGRASELLEAAGAHSIRTEGPVRRAGWHLLGTARMGDDPATSVVNGWGRSHDVKNLFIVDGSVFVTSAAVNPTSTLQATALYVADRIKRNLANLFD